MVSNRILGLFGDMGSECAVGSWLRSVSKATPSVSSSVSTSGGTTVPPDGVLRATIDGACGQTLGEI